VENSQDPNTAPPPQAEAADAATSTAPTVIQTDKDAKNGLTKCPKCGATDISLNENTGKLRCNYCQYEWEPESALATSGLDEDIRQLSGTVIGSGTQDIIPSTDEQITFKCSACGAEVVVNTAESTQARCHWCRNMLSMNQQVANGAVPDMILPFTVTKKDAEEKIRAFVKKRLLFAHPKFKNEFKTDNIMGVYLPYMVIDANAHGKLSGQGEIKTHEYWKGFGDNRHIEYDADVYAVKREFDILIDDLTVESSADKLNQNTAVNSNNIINSIMPFDTKNTVKYDSNYLNGYSSEKRDSNIADLENISSTQFKDIARFKANDTLTQYDRGVHWDDEQLEFKGKRWVASYLPVWLYSYYEKKPGGKTFLHYAAVNGRTGETMGSVPINKLKLFIASAIAEVFGIIAFLLLSDIDVAFLFLAAGPIFYAFFYLKYRNTNARHTYEKETSATLENIVADDQKIGAKTGLRNAKIEGANNGSVTGSRMTPDGKAKNIFSDNLANQLVGELDKFIPGKKD
jgi:DNA-directed RNA polymerase subunit RPC12/RpoP